MNEGKATENAANNPPPPAENDQGGAQSKNSGPAKGRSRRRPSRRKKKSGSPASGSGNASLSAAPDSEAPLPTEAPEAGAQQQEASQPADKSAPRPASRARKGRGRAKKATPAAAAGPPSVDTGLNYKLLINSEEPEECRIALLENGKVESFYTETVSREQSRGNIYKGRVTAVEPNLQAAFVDIGTEKNGFLPLSDIHPEYFYREVDPDLHWKDIKIQDVIRKGQEVLVEVEKEGGGTKGANMTTYLSLPGRYLVLMPGSDSAGISRKIEDEAQRNRLREMMQGFKLPEGIGYIVRTASLEITKTALSNDLRYLLNLWKEIKKRGQTASGPGLIYKEQNIISRFLRDHFTSDIQEILVDTKEAHDQVVNFLNLLPAKQRQTKVKLHTGSRPIFNLYNVEEQIEQIYQPKVNLPSGGSIVINPTEALVAIDVNSGRTSKDKNFAETIFLANMEAAEELARQLRLRDLGGLIVVDFIDMRDARHIREVEKKVRGSMKRDKAKVDFSRISKFGLMQISRQKMGSPVQLGSYILCEHCQGRGMVRSAEAQALACLRQIQTGIQKNTQRVECRLPVKAAHYLLNRKREELMEMEKRFQVQIAIQADPALLPSEQQIDFVKSEKEHGAEKRSERPQGKTKS